MRSKSASSSSGQSSMFISIFSIPIRLQARSNMQKPNPATVKRSRYLCDEMTEPVYEYEKYLGFDGVKRMAFRIPFACFDTTVLEETLTYVVRLDTDGWIRKYHKNSNLVEELKAPVEEEKDWYTLKDKVREHLELYCTDENIGKVYGKYAQAHKRGDFSLRFRAQGFFWLPRTLLGIEGQMYAFYDMPEVIHDMNRFAVEVFREKHGKIFDIIQPEVMLFEEETAVPFSEGKGSEKYFCGYRW